MRDAWFIARKDIQYALREREALLWLFVMPIVFFAFIGSTTKGFSGSGSRAKIALSAPEDAGFVLDRLEQRLDENGYDLVRPESEEEREGYRRRLEIPAGFTDSVLAGEPSLVRFERTEGGPSAQYDNVRIGRAVYTTLADIVATARSEDELSLESFEKLDRIPRGVSLTVESAGRIPTGFEQAVPGIMVMFTLITLLTTGAVTILIERQQGLLRRLASTPISRTQVVLGKWLGRILLGLVQIAFAMVAGSLIFGMDWGPNLPTIAVVMGGWAALCASLGLLMGCVARTEGQAVGIGVLSANVLAALGGCWWPIEITPDWMRSLARLLPTGWTMDALHQLVSFGHGPASVLGHVALLFGSALAVGWLAARRFRFQ